MANIVSLNQLDFFKVHKELMVLVRSPHTCHGSAVIWQREWLNFGEEYWWIQDFAGLFGTASLSEIEIESSGMKIFKTMGTCDTCSCMAATISCILRSSASFSKSCLSFSSKALRGVGGGGAPTDGPCAPFAKR